MINMSRIKNKLNMTLIRCKLNVCVKSILEQNLKIL